MTGASDWMRLRSGVRVHRRANPRHVGRVVAIHHGAFVRVKWEPTGWIEDDIPLAELMRADWEAGKMLAGVVLAALLLAMPGKSQAQGAPLPVPKPRELGGSCPHGYTTSGSFCIPSQGAQDAIAKPSSGICPSGWTASGSYCLRWGKR